MDFDHCSLSVYRKLVEQQWWIKPVSLWAFNSEMIIWTLVKPDMQPERQAADVNLPVEMENWFSF